MAGSSIAAGDLYGAGVRVGIYLQGFGMLLPIFRSGTEHGRGLKIAAGCLTLSFLASWTLLASKKLFSPCEAYLILHILTSTSIPAFLAVHNPRTIVGEGIGLIVLMVTHLWLVGAFTWTCARLVYTLPLFDTANIVFFFGKTICLATLVWLRYVAELLIVAWLAFQHDQTELSDRDVKGLDVSDRLVKTWWALLWKFKALRPSVRAASEHERVVMRIRSSMGIATVEKTIKWNGLVPTTDLTSPGQLIPLVVGVTVAADGVAAWVSPRGRPSGGLERRIVS
ncbi:hypothetical protein DL98DRAFT_659751 [Cadophora sp. DSE1049]|nr:hypothetical protein DL98DRAFT_659751 [Cadophora sp. DSE1049]